PDVDDLRAAVTAVSVDDATIEDVIRAGVGTYGEVFCPHTAVAVHVLEGLVGPGNRIVVATAHPAKFESIVEPLIGRAVEVPPALEALFERATECVEIAATLEALTSEQ